MTAAVSAPVEAGALAELLESPPPGVYRLKGCVPVRTARGQTRYLVNLVGESVHVTTAPARGGTAGPDAVVAIGPDLDLDLVQAHLDSALTPAPVSTAGRQRLQ